MSEIEDVGLESLEVLSVAIGLEDHYGILISDEDIVDPSEGFILQYLMRSTA